MFYLTPTITTNVRPTKSPKQSDLAIAVANILHGWRGPAREVKRELSADEDESDAESTTSSKKGTSSDSLDRRPRRLPPLPGSVEHDVTKSDDKSKRLLTYLDKLGKEFYITGLPSLLAANKCHPEKCSGNPRQLRFPRSV